MWGLAKPAGILAALALAAMAVWLFATHWRPSTLDYPLQGIDLPLDAASVEWGSVRAAGADFAYLPATAGTRRRDSRFEANWAAVPEAGLRRGALHLYSLCAPGEAQANAFNTVVPRTEDALPPAVDVSYREDCDARPTPAALAADLARFAATVEAHSGKPVLLRVSRRVDADYALSAALGRPIWAMGNFIGPRYPSRPWRLWRASDIRRIDGVEGPVNWDVVAK